jgi:hypothetical protein
MCRLSLTDPAFPKYPRLPVIACAGYVPASSEAEQKDTTAGRRGEASPDDKLRV